jgi:hypothetical protein
LQNDLKGFSKDSGTYINDLIALIATYIWILYHSW